MYASVQYLVDRDIHVGSTTLVFSLVGDRVRGRWQASNHTFPTILFLSNPCPAKQSLLDLPRLCAS